MHRSNAAPLLDRLLIHSMSVEDGALLTDLDGDFSVK
jgi:hypothetical protein